MTNPAAPTPETDKFPQVLRNPDGSLVTTYFSLRVSHERLERALSAERERAEKAEKERDQQERFKWAANERCDRALAGAEAERDSAYETAAKVCDKFGSYIGNQASTCGTLIRALKHTPETNAAGQVPEMETIGADVVLPSVTTPAPAAPELREQIELLRPAAAWDDSEYLPTRFTARQLRALCDLAMLNLTPPLSPERCTWTQDENGGWHTAYDNYFEFNDGMPEDNGAKFCLYCGKTLDQKPYVEEVCDEC